MKGRSYCEPMLYYCEACTFQIKGKCMELNFKIMSIKVQRFKHMMLSFKQWWKTSEMQRGISQGIDNTDGRWEKVSGCDFQIGNTRSSSSSDDDVLSHQPTVFPPSSSPFHLSKHSRLPRLPTHCHCHSFFVEASPGCLFTSTIKDSDLQIHSILVSQSASTSLTG